jgi:flagellar protein FlaG
MLIQNTSSTAQVSVPIRFASDGGPNGVVAQPSASTDAPQVAVPQAVAQQPQPSDAQLAKEVNKINTALQQSNKNLELSFSVDQATNRQVVKLMDKTTGDTLLQYPSEAVLAISQGIDEFQHGLLLRQKA